MKLTTMSYCTELASSLSSNYKSTIPYDSTKSLTKYLESNGVLLTVCYPDSCLLKNENHLAASWINARIGVKIIPSMSHLALILDPEHANIQCIYPTDGTTDQRDARGCGPMIHDPVYGSQGAAKLGPIGRQVARWQLDSYKKLNFGKTNWTDIPCMSFFGIPFDIGSGTSWNSSHDFQNVSFRPFLALLQEQYQAIMGHPVCHVDSSSQPSFEDSWWVYDGPMSWDPSLWQQVMETQVDLFEAKGTSMALWNEVVLALPEELEDIILAVVYTVTPEMDEASADFFENQAKIEAGLLGPNKPVLRMDLTDPSVSDTDGPPLFECVENDSFY